MRVTGWAEPVTVGVLTIEAKTSIAIDKNCLILIDSPGTRYSIQARYRNRTLGTQAKRIVERKFTRSLAILEDTALVSTNDQFKLTSIRAFGESYPLRLQTDRWFMRLCYRLYANDGTRFTKSMNSVDF